MRRFREGEPFGVQTPRGLVIGDEEARRLNRIAESIGRVAGPTGMGGRLRMTPGGPDCDPEVPETFPARLTGGGPSYTWVEQAWDGSAFADVTGGRNSTDDGMAREYNGTSGLSGSTVIMQRWPGGIHRFQRVRLPVVGGGGGDPGPCEVCTTCDDDWPTTLTLTNSFGSVTLTKTTVASSTVWTGTQSITNCSAMVVPDCTAAAYRNASDCGANSTTATVVVFWSVSCLTDEDNQIGIGFNYARCSRCPSAGGGGTTGVALVCESGVPAACSDFAPPFGPTLSFNSAGFAAQNSVTADDVVTIDGDDSSCMYCDSLDGATLEFSVDMGSLGKGTVAVDVSGF